MTIINLSLSGLKSFNLQTQSYGDWVDETVLRAAKKDAGNNPNYIGKVTITIPRTGNLYSSKKIILKGSVSNASSNPCAGAVTAYITKIDYTNYRDIVKNGGYSGYGPGDALTSTALADSYAYINENYGTTTNITGSVVGDIKYFIFDCSEFKEDTNYYVYLIRTNNSYNGYMECDNLSAILEYEQTVTLDPPSLTNTTSLNSGKYIIPTNNKTFSCKWSAISNASGYYWELKSENELLASGTTSELSFSTNYNVQQSFRGKTITAYVRAQGNGKYRDSSVNSCLLAVVNSVPDPPTAEKNYGDNSVSYTISSGKDKDTDQKYYIYYKINEGQYNLLNGYTLTIDRNTLNLKHGVNTLYLKANDGLEDSSDNSDTFSITLGPVLEGINVNNASIKDSLGNTSDILIKQSTIEYVLTSGSVASMKVYIKSGSSPSNLGQEVELTQGVEKILSSNQAKITILNIPENILQSGHYFSFKIAVSDDNKNYVESDWTEIKRRANKPALPTYLKCLFDATNRYGSLASEGNYFGNKVTIDYNYLEKDNSRAAVTYVQIMDQNNNVVANIPSADSSASSTIQLDLSGYKVGSTIELKFKTQDELGQVTIGNKFVTLKKASLPSFITQKPLFLSISNLRPIKNKDKLIISHPIATADGTQTMGYYYTIKVGAIAVNLNVDNYIASSPDGTREIIIPYEDINNIINNLSINKNTAHQASMQATAINAFGSINTLTANFTINYTEPPYFIDDTTPTFPIKHNFYVSDDYRENDKVVNPSLLPNDDLRMFNKGEGVVLCIPAGADPNNDLSEYQIYIDEEDNLETDTALLNKWKKIVTLSADTISQYTTQENNYYLYRYNIPQYSKNQFLYFKVVLKDSTNNLSEKEKISSTYIIGCRTTTPTFNIGNFKVSRNVNVATLKYTLKIADLGGSAPSTGWDINYYNTYENFDREIDGYLPTAWVKVDIAADQNFIEGLQEGTWVHYSAPNGLLNVFSGELESKFQNFSENYQKIYARFTLQVSYGINKTNDLAKISSQPKILAYYGEVPTVVHRSHRVGINATSFNGNEAFVVESYPGNEIVAFRGIGSSGNANQIEIVFNLSTGTIDGAIIDGGAW